MTKLSESEISLLNKRLNFCPSTRKPNQEQLLDDLYFFCQKLKLKQYFYGGDNITDIIEQEERCDLNTKLPNCYFNPNHETPLNLQRYISVVKKEVTELLKNPNYQEPNLTSDERLKPRYLSENRYLTIKAAHKGGKIVIIDVENPTLIYTKEVKQKN